MARWFDEREAERRQAEQEAARAHEAAQESLRPASEQKVKTAPLVVNLDKQTNQSAARVASRIPDETERDGFLNEYIAHVKKQKSPNYQKYAPSIGTMREMTDATVTGGVYADTRAKNEKQRLKEIETQKAGKTAMLELAEMPLMGFDGQSINANTADAATVIRGINAIADDTLRARAAKAFKTLTQTEGSRFYGENADGVGTFLESANLTRDEYRDATEDYANRFYGDGKHDKEDAAAYLKARQEIEESAYSDYAKSQLTAALDKAYTGITGGETPSASAEGASTEAADEKRATEEDRKKEKKPGFWSGLTGKVPEQEKQEKAESPAQAKAQSRIVSQTMTASTAPGFPTAGKASGKAPEVQGPVQMTPEERIVAQGGMSFAEWMATTPSVSSADTSLKEGGRERTDEAGAEIRMHEAQTIGEAADALLKGRYDRIEGAGKDELDRMLAESGNARRMIGTLTEADSQRIIVGNDMADAVTYGNIAAQGQTVKTLYDVMKSDSFPDELRGRRDGADGRMGGAGRGNGANGDAGRRRGAAADGAPAHHGRTCDGRAGKHLRGQRRAADRQGRHAQGAGRGERAGAQRRAHGGAQGNGERRAAGAGAPKRAGGAGRAERGHGLRRAAGGGGRLFQAGREQKCGQSV